MIKFIFHKLIQYIWEPFSLKKSHFWNWIDYTKKLDLTKTVSVEGDFSKKPRVNFISNLLYTNFIWNKTVIIQNTSRSKCFFGFLSKEEGKVQYCDILIDSGEKVAFLLGHHPFTYFALNENGEQINFNFIRTSTKKQCQEEGIEIL